MIEALVLAAIIGSLAFIAAWASSPRLRARIERPKYEFQERLRRE